MAQTIDMHTHWFPESWPDLAKRYGTPDWPLIKHTGPGTAEIFIGHNCFRKITAACWDPEVRLEEMDRDGIELQLISHTPVLFSYERPVAHADDVSKFFNDALLEFCARGKGRLKSLCQVPLQDTKAAVRELSRCMKAGHVGVEIGNHVGEKNLDDPGIIEFLGHCAAEGAAVLVHPWDMMGSERMPNYMMPWTVGMPAETHLAIVSLIKSGGFDQLPKDLRICFAHGGGSFAFLLGRLENAWAHHPVARGKSELPPSHYVSRFYVDSAVFDQNALQLLVQVMGSDRVVLGSDYPFPLGEENIGRLVRESKLAPDVKAKILGANAHGWLNLSKKTKSKGTMDKAAAGNAGNKDKKGEGVVATAGCPMGKPAESSAYGGASGGSGKAGGTGAPLLTYSSYLRIPELLHLQHPQSKPEHHDEMMFIIIHQTYELWFKELLHDLDAVTAAFRHVSENAARREEIYEAARLLRRCTEIMRVAVSQFTILETMLPTHFLAFRGKLEPASGFQSEQFREIEFLCGQKDEKLLRHHDPSPEAMAALQRRLAEPSLHDVFFDALHTIGKLKTPRAQTNEEQRALAVRDLYTDEQHFRDWIDVCERLVEFDELVMSWRLRHIQLVERTIGMRSGTGGSAGSSYLRTTLDKKFFPELWEARTMLEQPSQSDLEQAREKT
ncbi:MAG: tryptophan 2,3-dioxygenase family protein [Acidobacteriota bacterium]|nr:tryptophan 2,3-dioxygenase family protein [Acidobacteriota bacterium]